MRKTRPRLPRPEFRQQFPYLSLQSILFGIEQQVRLLQRGCGDGEFIEIQTRAEANDACAMLEHLSELVLATAEGLTLPLHIPNHLTRPT